jgi:hypothetical protein
LWFFGRLLLCLIIVVHTFLRLLPQYPQRVGCG